MVRLRERTWAKLRTTARGATPGRAALFTFGQRYDRCGGRPHPRRMSSGRVVQVPFAFEQRDRVLVPVFDAERVDFLLELVGVEVRARDPARHLVREPLEQQLRAVFV